eukprot:386660-Amphidinium_carterae.1
MEKLEQRMDAKLEEGAGRAAKMDAKLEQILAKLTQPSNTPAEAALREADPVPVQNHERSKAEPATMQNPHRSEEAALHGRREAELVHMQSPADLD